MCKRINLAMGNHDRLINSDSYDAIRKYIQEKLGLIPGQKFHMEIKMLDFPFMQCMVMILIYTINRKTVRCS